MKKYNVKYNENEYTNLKKMYACAGICALVIGLIIAVAYCLATLLAQETAVQIPDITITTNK